jgi:hypothetical protein
MDAVLAVGPRELPDKGMVKVWVDSGSGGGHEIMVSVCDLAMAEMDDGRGTSAIYTICVRTCRG